MATKTHHRSRRSRRIRRVRKAICRQWLARLVAHTLAIIVLMLVARWLHLPVPDTP